MLSNTLAYNSSKDVSKDIYLNLDRYPLITVVQGIQISFTTAQGFETILVNSERKEEASIPSNFKGAVHVVDESKLIPFELLENQVYQYLNQQSSN